MVEKLISLPDVSIIIPCKNELNNIKKTVDSIMNSKNQLSFEIIVVDDGSTDGCCDFINIKKDVYKDVKLISTNNMGAAGARNLGFKKSSGKYVFFCDAHIEVPDYFLDNLVKTLEENNAHCITATIKVMGSEGRGYGGTWDSNLQFKWLGKPKKNGVEIPIASAGAFLIKSDIFKAVGGFDSNLEVYGAEDQELSLKLWLFGYKIIVDTSVEIEHLFKTAHPYIITNSNIIYNFLCMIYLHFDYKNLCKALNIVRKDSVFPKALAKIMINESLFNQREEYFRKRIYDENYIFQKFNIYF